MKRIALIPLLFLIITSVYSSSVDTTIYKSEYEKRAFLKQLNTDQGNPLELLLSFNYTEDIESRFASKLLKIKKYLGKKSVDEKKLKRQVLETVKYIQKDYLKEYDPTASFNDLILEGRYNYISATALYALIFDEYNIPYSIIENPEHLYLSVGDPENPIYIKTVKNKNQSYYYDIQFKIEYVDFLIQNQLITIDTSQKTYIDNLFEEHFLREKNIDLIQLAAHQYSSRGLSNLGKNSLEEAAVDLEKAHILYNSFRNQYAYNAALTNLTIKQREDKSYEGKIWAKYLNINIKNKYIFDNTQIIIRNILQDLSSKPHSREEYHRFYKDFKRLLHNSLDKNYYDRIYYYHLAKSDFKLGEIEKALDNAHLSHLMDPENVETLYLIREIGNSHILIGDNFKSKIESLEYFFERYPFISELEYFKTYYAFYLLKITKECYSNLKINEGREYFKVFDQYLLNHPEVTIIDLEIENLIVIISNHYILTNEISDALYYTKIGVQMKPESAKLIKLRDRIQSFTKGVADRNAALNKRSAKVDDFKERFLANFEGCWKVQVLQKDRKIIQDPTYNNLIIKAKTGRKLEYTFNNKKSYGRWSIRGNSKLMYLIPDEDPEAYLIFKVLKIKEDQLYLKHYTNRRLNKITIVMEHCR